MDYDFLHKYYYWKQYDECLKDNDINGAFTIIDELVSVGEMTFAKGESEKSKLLLKERC